LKVNDKEAMEKMEMQAGSTSFT